MIVLYVVLVRPLILDDRNAANEKDGNSLSIVYSILLTVIKSLIVELKERSSTEQ